MGNVHLVTGYAGKAHVTAADHGSLFESAIAGGQFVLPAGEQFAASIISNNEIRISDGEGVMQGRHFKLDPGSYVTARIDNGSATELRNDLIVGRYTKSAQTGIEEFNIMVIKGTPAGTAPVDPVYISGSINAGGALVNDIPLYRVVIVGLSITEVVPLFRVRQLVSSPVYMDMLWQNPTPDAEFPAQTITVPGLWDANAYQFILITASRCSVIMPNRAGNANLGYEVPTANGSSRGYWREIRLDGPDTFIAKDGISTKKEADGTTTATVDDTAVRISNIIGIGGLGAIAATLPAAEGVSF